MAVMLAILGLGVAWAEPSAVPRRQIPPSVLVEVGLLENRFELALAADCDSQRCYSKGCTYVDHAVIDRPRSSSLPGLMGDAGPGSVTPQEFLTQARCAFAHEDSVSGDDALALVRRLQSKLSTDWTVVTVGRQELAPLPATLQEPLAPEPEAEEPPPPPPEPWSAASAGRELWTTLLPHFAWMIALALGTLAGTTLIWAWRRVGRESLEERALLAQLARGDDEGPAAEAAPSGPSDEDPAFVATQQAAWTQRLEGTDPDPELQAMIRELLRAGELDLLSKAVLMFPDTFPARFPTGGDVAAAKLELADHLKAVDVSTLPADADFFRSLNRHALSAALASQSDAQMVRSLREEFGAAGLASLVGSLPGRPGALLFALAPADEQHEMARLLSPRQMAELADQLLRSNRMDPGETAYLFDVLRAARSDEPLPPPPRAAPVSDRGAEFDATGALSVLLPNVHPDQRGALFAAALERFHGSPPAWYRGIFLADMLFELPDEARTDLLLEVDVEQLSAWLSLLDADTRQDLLAALPSSLQTSVAATSTFPSRPRQLALADGGRRSLARGFQAQLTRSSIPFERVLHPQPTGGP